MNRAAARRPLVLASGNPGKLKEYQVLAAGLALELQPLPGFANLPEYPENSPTFAENAAGKALHYSKYCDQPVFADDSGLVVPSLGGAPGVHSARYAGVGAPNELNISKLLGALQRQSGPERTAYFVCVIAVALRGNCVAVVSAKVVGEILQWPQGTGGFGYDPIFYFPPAAKAFAELSPAEKNQHSHRGKAFRRLVGVLGITCFAESGSSRVQF
jgi:XTP/dITP diphosphohydrolase